MLQLCGRVWACAGYLAAVVRTRRNWLSRNNGGESRHDGRSDRSYHDGWNWSWSWWRGGRRRGATVGMIALIFPYESSTQSTSTAAAIFLQPATTRTSG